MYCCEMYWVIHNPKKFELVRVRKSVAKTAFLGFTKIIKIFTFSALNKEKFSKRFPSNYIYRVAHVVRSHSLVDADFDSVYRNHYPARCETYIVQLSSGSTIACIISLNIKFLNMLHPSGLVRVNFTFSKVKF